MPAVSEITGNRIGCWAEAVQDASAIAMASLGVMTDFMRCAEPDTQKRKGYK